MLETIGFPTLDALIDATVPSEIRSSQPLSLPPAASEAEALDELKRLMGKNRVYKSLIGQGYYGTLTPAVIQRCILENPGWYTAYTPYQAEISQGRLEALLNFQTMVCDLTGLDVSNASLLDEATAAAEAVHVRLCIRQHGSEVRVRHHCVARSDHQPRRRTKTIRLDGLTLRGHLLVQVDREARLPQFRHPSANIDNAKARLRLGLGDICTGLQELQDAGSDGRRVLARHIIMMLSLCWSFR